MNLVRLRDILLAAKDDPVTREYASQLLRIVDAHEAEVRVETTSIAEPLPELFEDLPCNHQT